MLMLPFRWYKQALPVWIRALLFAIVAPGAVAGLFPYLLLSLDWQWEQLELGAARYLGLPFMLVGGLSYVAEPSRLGGRPDIETSGRKLSNTQCRGVR